MYLYGRLIHCDLFKILSQTEDLIKVLVANVFFLRARRQKNPPIWDSPPYIKNSVIWFFQIWNTWEVVIKKTYITLLDSLAFKDLRKSIQLMLFWFMAANGIRHELSQPKGKGNWLYRLPKPQGGQYLYYSYLPALPPPKVTQLMVYNKLIWLKNIGSTLPSDIPNLLTKEVSIESSGPWTKNRQP